MKKSKYSFTLLEIAIALSLAGILLSVLWSLHHRWYKAYLEIQKVQSQTHASLLFYHRMQRILSLFASSENEGSKFFFTPKEMISGHLALYFSYENAPDPEPEFNGPISSLLYMNEARQLCLATWSSKNHVRNEVLLDNVVGYMLSFFDLERKEWREKWPEDHDAPPLWMKISLQGDQIETFTFRLMQTKDPIVYFERES